MKYLNSSFEDQSEESSNSSHLNRTIPSILEQELIKYEKESRTSI